MPRPLGSLPFVSRSPFVVQITELRRERAAPKPVTLEASVDWSLELSRVLPEPRLVAHLELSPVSGGVLVEGTVEAAVGHTCHRCLDEWTEVLSVPVTELFVSPPEADADYATDGHEIDLEPLLRDEVLLSLPLAPTCPDGCAGVVDGSQSDLNTPTPDDAGGVASPFAVLKDLLDDGE